MIFTLQRYIFRELFRVFILATIGLTLILSLGGILQPVQEYGVGPRQVVHILLYFMPITLTFVLPMAALFASALTYGRFAGDNELDACRASGVSLTTLVYPGLILAILVAIANLILSFHVMPYFVHRAERSLKADAKQILFRNIQRTGYYALPPEERYRIYADHADPRTDTLMGIVVVEASEGRMKRIVTSEMAKIHFDPHDRFNEVRLVTYNTRQMGSENDIWFEIGTASFTQEFGSLLGDEIKFKKIHEMKQIRSNLMLFDPIAKMARATYAQLATELLARDISTELAGSQGAFFALAGTSHLVRFRATQCVLQGTRDIALLPPVVVEDFDVRTKQLRRTLRCEKAVIHVEESAENPTVGLDLSSVRIDGTGQLLVRDVIGDLELPVSIRQRLRSASILEVVAPERAASILRGPPSAALARLEEQLAEKMTATLVDIKAEINSRLVFGIGCIPMILIGIALGIVKRGGHLLSAFGASCLPAALLIVAIISGKHITENVGSQAVSGILIMWAGLALLVLLAALLYGVLRRH